MANTLEDLMKTKTDGELSMLSVGVNIGNDVCMAYACSVTEVCNAASVELQSRAVAPEYTAPDMSSWPVDIPAVATYTVIEDPVPSEGEVSNG